MKPWIGLSAIKDAVVRRYASRSGRSVLAVIVFGNSGSFASGIPWPRFEHDPVCMVPLILALSSFWRVSAIFAWQLSGVAVWLVFDLVFLSTLAR